MGVRALTNWASWEMPSLSQVNTACPTLNWCGWSSSPIHKSLTRLLVLFQSSSFSAILRFNSFLASIAAFPASSRMSLLLFMVLLKKFFWLYSWFNDIIITSIIQFVETVKRITTTIDDTQFIACNSRDYLFGLGESAFYGKQLHLTWRSCIPYTAVRHTCREQAGGLQTPGRKACHCCE